MKRWARAVLVLFAAALALLAADTNPFPAPTVIVYPLTATGGTPADLGGTVAVLLSQKLADLGGLVVKPYTPGTQRPQYLQAALDANADYYVTGYLTPLGNDVSLIAQVVSTHSGSITYSTSAVVHTFGDIAGQADGLREAILRHAGRGFPAVEAPPPAPTGGAQSSSAGVNLSKALGRHARGEAAPSPSASAATGLAEVTSAPSPAPAPTATPPPARTPRAARPAATPSASPAASPAATAAHVASTATRARGGLITRFDGSASADQRAHAQAAFAAALLKGGLSGGLLPVSPADGVKFAGQLCAATPGSKALFTATLSIVSATNATPTVELDAVAYDCSGAVIGRQNAQEKVAGKGGFDGAIDRVSATDAAALSRILTGT